MSSVFVTVGTTLFEDLVEEVSSKACLQALHRKGYSRLLVQHGKGKDVANKVDENISISSYDFKSTIQEDINNADLVISHAGAGSCLEVLEAGKKLLVVVNEKLMDNHQIELAKKLHENNHLKYCTTSTLVETVETMDLSRLRPLPPPKSEEWAEDVLKHLRVGKYARAQDQDQNDSSLVFFAFIPIILLTLFIILWQHFS